MNQWCTQDSDGCGQFVQEKKHHIAPLTPQWEVAHELWGKEQAELEEWKKQI